MLYQTGISAGGVDGDVEGSIINKTGDEKMTQEEWDQKSEEWRAGWNAYAHDETVDFIDLKPEEWKEGFYTAMRTTGAGPQ